VRRFSKLANGIAIPVPPPKVLLPEVWAFATVLLSKERKRVRKV
jgi:hypothetical protein